MLSQFAYNQIRHVVGLSQSYRSQHRQVYEQQKQAANERDVAIRELHQAKQEADAISQYQYTPEMRAKAMLQAKARVEYCESALARIEAYVAELALLEKALQPYVRQTSKVAEALINALDKSESQLRDDLRHLPVLGTTHTALDPAQIANQFAPATQFTRNPT